MTVNETAAQRLGVRAKFVVQSVTQYQGGNEITLTAVTGGSEENKAFFKYTPSGTIKLGTINPGVADQMGVGDEFYVDFTKVVK